MTVARMEIPPATPAKSHQQADSRVSSLLAPDPPTANFLPLQNIPLSKSVILHSHDFQTIYMIF